jgi:predicted ATP-grasp superfamily ATP-dependent carboligase
MVEASGAGGLDEENAWQLRPRLLQRCHEGQIPAVVLGDLTLVRPLGWQGVPVVAVSLDAGDVSFRSRYVDGVCVVPGYLPPHDRQTVQILESLGTTLQLLARGARIPLIYGSDAQLEMLYRHHEALERRFLFLLNKESLGWAFNDKGHFFALCQQTGVPVPRTVVPAFVGSDGGGPQALAAAVAALTPPLVVKPRTKSDWKDIQQALFQSKSKARVFADGVALLSHPGFAAVRDRLVIQECVEGAVSDLRSFHGFIADDGTLLAWFSGHKLHTYPQVAGESALLELDHDPEVEAVGKDTVDRLGLRGPFKLDLIRDARSGQLFVLEVNARFNLWHHLGAAHGVNVPLVAYHYLIEGRRPARSPEYQPRVRWQNVYRDLKAVRELGPAGAGPSLGSLLFRPTVHELFAWRDPAPFLARLSKVARGYLPRRRRWPATA